jgi:acetate kinase
MTQITRRMMSPESHILALNSGSSSLKFGLYRVGPTQIDLLISGEAAAIGSENATFEVGEARDGALHCEHAAIATQADALIRVGKLFAERNLPAPSAVGHRIVHGGPKLLRHCLIDAAVLRELEAAAVFAPLHVPPALAVIRCAAGQFPGRAQVACFDTSFHADLPLPARVLPLPRALQAEGIRRYGFHGLSCESIVRQLAAHLPDRLVIAHLGNGASVTAVKAGRSIDTSMGLTPTGGVIMGTRTGDLDPGALIYLLRQKKLDAAMLEDLIDHRSGLLGISGIASDMRRLHAAAPLNAQARLAIQMFCYCARKQIAAMAAVLEGIDMLVFTGGIGENDAVVRASICSGLSWMGVSLDASRSPVLKNSTNETGLPCAVRTLPAQEDVQIARHTWELAPQSAG